MLASGAHVSINGAEFLLDEETEKHYDHRFRDLVPENKETSIVGAPGKRVLTSDSLYWCYTDWAGGEGNRNYNEDEYDTYDMGWELNPRIRGQITGRPNRYRIQATVTDVRERPRLTVGAGKIFMSCGIDLFYSTDPTNSFTQISDVNDVKLNSVSANFRITALAADDKWCYFSAWHSASSGTRVTRFVDTSGSDGFVEASATGKVPYAALVKFNGRLYAWTGQKLYEMDVDGLASGGTGLAADKIRKVYDTGAEPTGTLETDYWAGAFATDNSVIFWFSTPMQSQVFEYKKGIGRPVWTVPYGFTVKDGAFSNGVAMFAGHYDADGGTAGYGATWALPLDSYRPIFAKYVRRNIDSAGTAMQLRAMSPSYGMQIMMCATHTGRIFIYDLETDGVTMLDQLSRSSGSDPDNLTFVSADNRIGATITYGRYRVVAVYRPGAAAAGTEEVQVVTYDDDETNNIETGLNATDYTGLNGWFRTPWYDFDYPMERKTLVGIHLAFKQLVSGQTIKVEYAVDGSTSFSTAATVTSTEAGTTEGSYFIKLGTVNFTRVRLRVTLTSSSGVAVPILYSVTTQARLARKREEWDLVLRVKDNQQFTRMSNGLKPAAWFRDKILGTDDNLSGSAVLNSKVVTFLDGYRYRDNKPRYTSHDVVITNVEDIINQKGEGVMYVRLQKVVDSNAAAA